MGNDLVRSTTSQQPWLMDGPDAGELSLREDSDRCPVCVVLLLYWRLWTALAHGETSRSRRFLVQRGAVVDLCGWMAGESSDLELGL